MLNDNKLKFWNAERRMLLLSNISSSVSCVTLWHHDNHLVPDLFYLQFSRNDATAAVYHSLSSEGLLGIHIAVGEMSLESFIVVKYLNQHTVYSSRPPPFRDAFFELCCFFKLSLF